MVTWPLIKTGVSWVDLHQFPRSQGPAHWLGPIKKESHIWIMICADWLVSLEVLVVGDGIFSDMWFSNHFDWVCYIVQRQVTYSKMYFCLIFMCGWCWFWKAVFLFMFFTVFVFVSLTSGWWVMGKLGGAGRDSLAPPGQPTQPGSHRQVAQLWTRKKFWCLFSASLWMLSVSSCSAAWEPTVVMGECLFMVITHKHLICQCQQVCAEKLIFSEVRS